MSFLVFEGPDGSGKTSIAYRLARKTNATLINCGPPPPGKAAQTWEELVQFAADAAAPVVFDRLHWGDYPYGTLFHEPQLGVEGILRFDRMITRLGGAVVYVYCDPDEAIRRVAARGEELAKYEDPAMQRKIIDLYNEVYAASVADGNDVIMIDASIPKSGVELNDWQHWWANSFVGRIQDDSRRKGR